MKSTVLVLEIEPLAIVLYVNTGNFDTLDTWSRQGPDVPLLGSEQDYRPAPMLVAAVDVPVNTKGRFQ